MAHVKFTTNHGEFTLDIDEANAPNTAANFLQYVRDGHYDNTIFHRVIDGFMIQGGGLGPNMQEKPKRAPIALEAQNGLSNLRGTVAMARTSDPDSATSQFFINVVDNPRLDTYGGGYAVFGKVVDGMDVVDKIKSVPTASKSGHQNVPVNDIVIKKATLEK